jgi:hypothetical protein
MLDTCDLADTDEAVNLMYTDADTNNYDADASPAAAIDSMQGSSDDLDNDFGVAALVAAGLRNLVKE